MRTRKQIDVGSKQCARAHSDGTTIDENTVEVDKDAFSQPHVEPVVHFDGCFNPGLVFELLFVCNGVIYLWGKRCFVVDDTVRAGLYALDPCWMIDDHSLSP